jgi:2-amino-4-hydroxy-6-hydroxymethyldihydropteridine diphosphokinase
MTRCYLALGGNTGPVEQTFDRALSELGAEPRLALGQSSSLHRTRAVGPRAGDDYLNAVAELDTSLAPLELLDRLMALEDRAGRIRTGRWTPRPLDLDLLFYGSEIIDLPRLTVPHPACWYRRFVLDPLCEVAAGVVHPVKGLTAGGLRERLLVRPLPVALAGGDASARGGLIAQLARGFPEIAPEDWHQAEGAPDPALLFWLGAPRPATPTRAARTAASFDELPIVPRLDATRAADAAEFIGDVLTAALG